MFLDKCIRYCIAVIVEERLILFKRANTQVIAMKRNLTETTPVTPNKDLKRSGDWLWILLLVVSLASCSDVQTNEDIIRSTYEGSDEERGTNLADHVDKNLVWIEANGFPYAGEYHGLDEVIRMVFDRLNQDWDDFTFTPEHYISDKDQVVVVGNYSGVNSQTKRLFKTRVAHVWKLRGKKIIRFEQIVDSYPVWKAIQ